MAGNNAENVSLGKPKVGGSIYKAPFGTELPTSTADALNDAFVCLGYISEDGLTNANSPESGTIKAWGGDTVLSYESGKTDTFQFKLIESLNTDVLKTVYGDDNVSGELATGVTVKANNTEHEAFSWVVDMILRGGGAKRIVVPSGTVTEVDDIEYGDEDATGYNVTVTATTDSDGNTHYEYITKS